MRIGDSIQISGKKVTPLKYKSTSAIKRQTETINGSSSSKKEKRGQIIASKITEKSIQYLIKSDYLQNPHWEEKEKLLATHKGVIKKYEKQQKGFLASKLKQPTNDPIIVSNSDDSEDDKNKLNAKRKLCIGGKAPLLPISKKLCNETTKEVSPINSKLQGDKNNNYDENVIQLNQLENEKVIVQNNSKEAPIKHSIINTEYHQQKRNNLFEQTGYYKIQNNTNNTPNRINKVNNPFQNNNKISQKVFSTEDNIQQLNTHINPKNIDKIHEKQVQKIFQQQQPIQNINENSKNFSDIENISYLNNSLSEEQKQEFSDNKMKSNNSKYITNKQNNNLNKNSLTNNTPTFFKKDDITLAKKKSFTNSPKETNNTNQDVLKVSQQNKFIKSQPLINDKKDNSKNNSTYNNKDNINHNNKDNNRDIRKDHTQDNNKDHKKDNNNIIKDKSPDNNKECMNSLKKSPPQDKEKVVINIKSFLSELNYKKSDKQQSNPDPIQNKIISEPQKKTEQNEQKKQPIESDDEVDDDGNTLKNMNFTKYLFDTYSFVKQTPKRATIKNFYSPSKSPMIDVSKENQDKFDSTQSQQQQSQQPLQQSQQPPQQSQQPPQQSQQPPQSQYIESQVEDPFKHISPLKELLEKNFKRMNEIIQNSENIRQNSNNITFCEQSQDQNINMEKEVQNLIEKNVQEQDNNQIEEEEKNIQIQEIEKEKADYSQFQQQQIQDYINSTQDYQNIQDQDDEESRPYILQLEKGKQEQQSQNEQTEQQVQDEKQTSNTQVKEQKIHKELQSTFEYSQQNMEEQKSQEYKNKIIKKDNDRHSLESEHYIPPHFESNYQQSETEQGLFQQQVQSIEQQLPVTGHFIHGDIAKKITACRPKDHEIYMEVEWEMRSNGQTPEKSTVNSKVVREHAHSLLIDFYESKIKFTYKNSQKKKSQSSSIKEEENSLDKNNSEQQ